MANSNIYYKSRKNFIAATGKRFSFSDNITEVEFGIMAAEDQKYFRKMKAGSSPVMYKKSNTGTAVSIKAGENHASINTPGTGLPGGIDINISPSL